LTSVSGAASHLRHPSVGDQGVGVSAFFEGGLFLGGESPVVGSSDEKGRRTESKVSPTVADAFEVL